YYGVLSFEVNKDLVKQSPTDWADLQKPEFANTVALAGDPRASNQAIQGVYAAGELAVSDASSPKIVIIGAGPAGIRASATLVQAGLHPVVIDEGHRAGGQIYRRPP
ncbi:FAD-binding protein, partial [bacterium M00.F.Ca.ET.228.01.1.1]